MNFALDVSRFAQKFQDQADNVVRKIVLEIGTRIVERSPVGDGSLWKHPPPKGYIGGRFRANWQYGNYAGAGIPLSDLPDIDPSGRVSIERIIAGLPAKGAAGTTHVLINNLPYAVRLEEGWSKQAPSGMVGLVVVEFQGIVEQMMSEEVG